MKLIYPAIFTPCLEKDGYTVIVPDLPGCVSEGDSLINAIDMGTDATSEWILGELEDGNSFPAPTPHNEIQPEPGSFVNLLVLEMDSYTEKFSNKTVRKNIYSICNFRDVFPFIYWTSLLADRCGAADTNRWIWSCPTCPANISTSFA